MIELIGSVVGMMGGRCGPSNPMAMAGMMGRGGMGRGMAGSADGMDEMAAMGRSMGEARARRGIGRGGDPVPEDDFELVGDRYGQMSRGDGARQRAPLPSSRIEED